MEQYDEDAPEDYYVEDAMKRSVIGEQVCDSDSEYSDTETSEDEDAANSTSTFQSPKRSKHD